MFKYKQNVIIIAPSFYEGQEGIIIDYIPYINGYDIRLDDGLMIQEREGNIKDSSNEHNKTPSK